MNATDRFAATLKNVENVQITQKRDRSMTEKAKAMLDGLVEKISEERVATFIRGRLFSDGVELPCMKWSLLNQFAVFMAGAGDARGYRQWQEAGRNVKKGAKALYILVPMIIGKKNGNEEAIKSMDSGESEAESKLWFKLMPVFRAEDTEGEPLDYEIRLKEFDPESLPLIEVARQIGIDVQPALTGNAGGWYGDGKIAMGSNSHRTFLHELSHAVDGILPGKSSDRDLNEVIAELSSIFLGSMYGAQIEMENTIAYIQSWAGRGHVAFQLMKAVGRVEEIYRYIAAAKEKAAESVA